jgi:glucose/arabinose dehydrogenase
MAAAFIAWLLNEDPMRLALCLLILPALACGLFGIATPAPPGLDPVTEVFPPPDTDIPAPPPATETSAPVGANAFPDPNAYTWALVAGSFSRPVDVQHAGDGSRRLFIVEQPGRIRIIQDGQVLETPFLDIRERVNDSGNEQGLLGLAFHPRYAENGIFFVNYSANNSDNTVARFHVSSDPNVADPATETKLMSVSDPFPNHNGGALDFGPDGYLYIGFGDGGAAGDPFGNGQSLSTLLGKVLRVDVDSGEPYAIPSDNPFANGGGQPEIWAYGLRNPWRVSFDRATGDFYIGDVGQGVWEEIDFIPAGSAGGENFGWDHREGAHDYVSGGPAGMIDPAAEYSHGEGGCSVTGGYVYRGPSLPEWQGIYLYGDYCTGIIWGLIRSGNSWQDPVLYDTGFNISSFGEDEAGELYLADLNGGVYRLARP